jgi:cell division transport system permease protein
VRGRAVRPLYHLARALDGLARRPAVALVATATLFVALFVTGLFAATLGGLSRLAAAWGGEVQMSVYLAPGSDLQAARAAAEAIAPGVPTETVTPAAALERLRGSFGEDASVLDGVADAVLPPSVELSLPSLPLREARALAARLRAIPGAQAVDYGSLWLERLEGLLDRLRLVGLVLLAALCLATAVLVSNTLRLAVYARKDEIDIMKLVGATDGFVQAPFLLEGLLQGVVGGGLAALALLALHAALAPRLAAVVALAARLGRPDFLPDLLLGALVGGGAALGLLASHLAVRRFLRVNV